MTHQPPGRLRRALLTALAGLVLLGGFLTGAVVLEQRYEELTAIGRQVPGTVVAVDAGFRGVGDSVDVRFTLDGQERVRSLQLDDTSPELRPGDPLTVLHHPEDPERLAAPGVHNDPLWAAQLVILALVGGVGLLVLGVVNALRWCWHRLR
ncbi:hypothetical protein JOF53_008243 [Crossiella equi]|uniref:DUF3592 domain-containing protein n=1 Tax=Crossiella equi TaxID=130796 RepID=A0ABS5AS30_9PSEU|nr:DUF3592 domain-containing protein [Crossiella equi]MBP2479371.1 hypothetical protein [Crossiella equi]